MHHQKSAPSAPRTQTPSHAVFFDLVKIDSASSCSGNQIDKSKSEAMFFPASLEQAKNDYNDKLPKDLLLPNNKKGDYVMKFKYLGSIITPLL